MADAESTVPGTEAVAAPPDGPPRAFQVAALARAKYDLSDALFADTGPLVVEDAVAAQEVAAAVNRVREAPRFPERAVGAADLAAAALIQEILRCAVVRQAAAGEGRGMG
ncbi:MAG TPA: hypothetical protein VLS92_05710, partial [Acidimicrobiia bacterium]|nr:hypothetical protein [Acidimicrobiia bacterium]